MSAAKLLRESLAPLVDLAFPPRCPLCGDAIGEQTGLCAQCWATLVIPAGPVCIRCQRPMPDGESECAPCMAEPPRHNGIAAGTLYNEPSRKLVLAFKHGGRIALASLMAGLVNARLPELEGEWKVVPVPLHRWRLWRRGYNQAAILAKAVAKRSGQIVLVDALVRKRQTPVLGGLGKQERRKVLSGAIAVKRSRADAIKGRNIILVDDVLTSGATTDACVRELRRAGAEKVIIACFARVLDDSETRIMLHQRETPGA